jgi:hypothetical protein
MNRQKLIQLSIGLMLATLLLLACSMLQPQAPPSAGPDPGLWRVSETTYDQSMIYFSVSNDSAIIKMFSMFPAGLPCGDAIRIGQIQFTAEENSSYEVPSAHPSEVRGEIALIDDDSFRIELPMLVLPFNAFDLQSGLLVFAGSFDSSSEASGTWDIDLQASGDKCSGTWTAVPVTSDNE